MSDKLALSTWAQDPAQLNFESPDTWYKGDHCHRFPQNRPVNAEDVLRGWLPPCKLIKRDTKVLAFGSCFAEYFIKFLSACGYNRWQLQSEQDPLCDEILLLALGQTFENIFVILQQFRWAFGEFTPQSMLWFTKDKQYFEATEARREKIRRSFEQVDVFVITLGLSEIWFDRVSNEPMWRSIPSRLYEPERHAFRRATVAETIAAFYELDRLIDEFLPGKHYIFTLSPIPLIATFRDQSPITANQVSKAILRVALDEFNCDPAIQTKSRYHYFPSYELVFHLFDHPFLPDNRHIRPEVASRILDIFRASYTDLPVAERHIPDGDGHVAALEAQVREMQGQLMAKERVIRELDQAACERQEIIDQLLAKRR